MLNTAVRKVTNRVGQLKIASQKREEQEYRVTQLVLKILEMTRLLQETDNNFSTATAKKVKTLVLSSDRLEPRIDNMKLSKEGKKILGLIDPKLWKIVDFVQSTFGSFKKTLSEFKTDRKDYLASLKREEYNEDFLKKMFSENSLNQEYNVRSKGNVLKEFESGIKERDNLIVKTETKQEKKTEEAETEEKTQVEVKVLIQDFNSKLAEIKERFGEIKVKNDTLFSLENGLLSEVKDLLVALDQKVKEEKKSDYKGDFKVINEALQKLRKGYFEVSVHIAALLSKFYNLGNLDLKKISRKDRLAIEAMVSPSSSQIEKRCNSLETFGNNFYEFVGDFLEQNKLLDWVYGNKEDSIEKFGNHYRELRYQISEDESFFSSLGQWSNNWNESDPKWPDLILTKEQEDIKKYTDNLMIHFSFEQGKFIIPDGFKVKPPEYFDSVIKELTPKKEEEQSSESDSSSSSSD